MSVTTNIDIAKVSIVLVNKAIELGQEKDTQLARKIHVVMSSIEAVNDSTPADTSLPFQSNFLYALCGGYAFKAESYLGTSGGIVIASSNGWSNYTPYPINVVVGLSQSGVQTITNTNWIGLQDINQVVIGQNVFQVGSQFTFNSVSGTFNFSLANYTLQTGDVMTSLGFALSNSGTSSTSVSTRTDWYYATAGVVTNIPSLIGKSIQLVLRGGIGTGVIILSGTPIGNEVLWNTATGDLTTSVDNEWVNLELLTIQHSL